MNPTNLINFNSFTLGRICDTPENPHAKKPSRNSDLGLFSWLPYKFCVDIFAHCSRRSRVNIAASCYHLYLHFEEERKAFVAHAWRLETQGFTSQQISEKIETAWRIGRTPPRIEDKIMEPLPGFSSFRVLHISSSNKRMYFCATTFSESTTLKINFLEKNGALETVTVPLSDVWISEKALFQRDKNHAIRVLHPDTCQLVKKLPNPARNPKGNPTVRLLIPYQEGERVLSIYSDGTTLLWDVEKELCLFQMKFDYEMVKAFAVVNDYLILENPEFITNGPYAGHFVPRFSIWKMDNTLTHLYDLRTELLVKNEARDYRFVNETTRNYDFVDDCLFTGAASQLYHFNFIKQRTRMIKLDNHDDTSDFSMISKNKALYQVKNGQGFCIYEWNHKSNTIAPLLPTYSATQALKIHATACQVIIAFNDRFIIVDRIHKTIIWEQPLNPWEMESCLINSNILGTVGRFYENSLQHRIIRTFDFTPAEEEKKENSAPLNQTQGKKRKRDNKGDQRNTNKSNLNYYKNWDELN
jgi:hypothetical protein